MDVNLKFSLYTLKKIRIFLVFFYSLLLFSCNETQQIPYFQFEYDGQANPYKLIFWGEGKSNDYSVRLQNKSTSIFGDMKQEGSKFSFIPIIPFSYGESYQVYKGNLVYFDFTIKKDGLKMSPKLLGIYPKLDTVPENLLKMYFIFDKPMQQTQSTLEFIKVFNVTQNKKVEIFLPLENELWNADKTELTLWLDPGRIKKDLIPNRERGIPIEKGQEYQIEIAETLEDQQGNSLARSYTKSFYVVDRDESKPAISDWQLTIPEVNTKSGLGIDFQESLDYLLIAETIRVFKGKEEVQGSFFVSKKGNSVVFIPEQAWEKGSYQIQIESRLEDLAGNNLNRLFDEDLKNRGEVDTSEFKVLEFKVASSALRQAQRDTSATSE